MRKRYPNRRSAKSMSATRDDVEFSFNAAYEPGRGKSGRTPMRYNYEKVGEW